MDSSNRLKLVISHFRSKKFQASKEWIEACVKYCAEESQVLLQDVNLLKQAVEDQWLGCDLKVEGTQSVSGRYLLPSQKFNVKHHTVKTSDNLGPFIFQVESCYDISGQSLYSQYQALKQVDVSNQEVESEDNSGLSSPPPTKRNAKKQKSAPKFSTSRMLKLELTNGVQNVTAIEHQPLRGLRFAEPLNSKNRSSDDVSLASVNKHSSASVEICYGLKVCLTPPFEVRRGVILLEPKCFKVLGGKIEEQDDSDVETREDAWRLKIISDILKHSVSGDSSTTNVGSIGEGNLLPISKYTQKSEEIVWKSGGGGQSNKGRNVTTAIKRSLSTMSKSSAQLPKDGGNKRTGGVNSIHPVIVNSLDDDLDDDEEFESMVNDIDI